MLLDDTVFLAAPAEPVVPGYRVTGLLGRGASASVWRAVPAAGGAAVAVKVVRPGPTAERELAVLTGVRHPHVLPLEEVVVLDDDRLALIVPLLDGGTLAQVVAARGRLEPGEVVTCLAPVAQAVADLHVQGVQHGDLAPGNVLLDRSGKPFLADLGTVRVTGEPRAEVFGTPGYVDPVVLTGGEPAPASDVHGLGALAWFALTGAPPPAVPCRGPLAELVAPGVPAAMVELVEAAVSPDPARRPRPEDLVRGLHAAAVAVPVWRHGLAPADGALTHRVDGAVRAAAARAGGEPRHRLRRSSRWRRASRPPEAPGSSRPSPPRGRPRWRAALVSVGAVSVGLTAALVGPGLVRPSPADDGRAGARTAPAPAARLEPVTGARLAADEARQVVAQLCTARAAAFAEGAGPTGAAPGSAADRDDRAALSALRARGLRYRSVRLVPRSVQVVRSDGARAVVDVVVDTSAYDVLDRSGQVVGRQAAVAGRRSRLELVRTSQGWRVEQARPA